MKHTPSPIELQHVPRSSRISLEINAQLHTVEIEHRMTLLDVLRDQLDLIGAKRACDRGECGACTVLVDEQPMCACHLLAMQVRGRKITTIEGLAERADFRPLLEAFVANDGGQCGFCTPGFADFISFSALKPSISGINRSMITAANAFFSTSFKAFAAEVVVHTSMPRARMRSAMISKKSFSSSTSNTRIFIFASSFKIQSL